MIGGVHVEVIPLGPVCRVRARRAAGVHVTEHKVPELGESDRRRFISIFKSERGSHEGVGILFSWERERKWRETLGWQNKNSGVHRGFKMRYFWRWLGENQRPIEMGLPQNLGLSCMVGEFCRYKGIRGRIKNTDIVRKQRISERRRGTRAQEYLPF